MKKFNVIEQSRFLDRDGLSKIRGGATCTMSWQ
jgi:hypothetical protein